MQPRVHAHHTHLRADPRRGSAGPAASAYKVTWQKYVVGLGEEGEVFEILAGGSPAIISPVVTSSKYTIRVFSRNLNHDPGLFPPSPSLPKAGCTCLPDPTEPGRVPRRAACMLHRRALLPNGTWWRDDADRWRDGRCPRRPCCKQTTSGPAARARCRRRRGSRCSRRLPPSLVSGSLPLAT